MIEIKDKHNCCGCSACAQKCPKQCISMQEDEEGFLYPNVEHENCIECGLCEQVCPVIHQNEPRRPLKVYAAINPDEEVRMKSSSGGIFSMLAEQTISNGGVVFGARFNDQWEVIHDYTETIEGLEAFRGSKYVQSTIGNNYKKAEEVLKQNREVLFSGTPCQIAGLKKFLQKEYENLFCVDVACHSVPSPLVWRDYLDHITSQKHFKITDIKSISFRNKKTGWKRYSIVIKDKEGASLYDDVYKKNIYMQGFLKDIYSRPSCFQCPTKGKESNSDLTIADYWGITQVHPQLDDNKGTGLILVNSRKGLNIIKHLSVIQFESEYDQAVRFNPAIEKSCQEPALRLQFWKEYPSHKTDTIETILEQMKPNVFERCICFFKRCVKFIIFKLTYK